MFKVEVEDDATDDEVTERMYERMGEILAEYCAADFDFLIEEEVLP